MNTVQILFIWIVSGIGFALGAHSLEEEAPGKHFAVGVIVSVLFAALAYQIIR